MALGKNIYIMEKRERGSIIIFPIKLRLLRRISNRIDGKGQKIMGKKIKILKTDVGKNFKLSEII